MRKQFLALALAAVGLLFGAAQQTQADPVFFGPTPYTSSANSPFNSVTFTYFHLENFEDNLLNTPGVAGTGVAIGPSSITDSVDADDGAIDGSGLNGHSYFNGSGGTGITFTFNAAALGGSLPTHVGIVWTDGLNPITFEAFGPGGSSLGIFGPFNHADTTITGGTGEDRFYGIFSSVGISSINIRNGPAGGIEVDHLQYGQVSQQPPGAIPEPTTLLLLGTGLAGVVARVRRRRKVITVCTCSGTNRHNV